jgi:peptidoglycan/LPS O-acetylase OafA/YrhL
MLASLGAASYSIYLWHITVNYLGTSAVRRILGFDDFRIYFATYILGSLCFGWAMNLLLEVPMLRLREKLFPSAR